MELESSANVRFLHSRTESKSLKAIAGLGGAGSGGAADEAHYLWPKYAAGMTYNSSFVDSLFGQAFYRPSRFVRSSNYQIVFYLPLPFTSRCNVVWVGVMQDSLGMCNGRVGVFTHMMQFFATYFCCPVDGKLYLE